MTDSEAAELLASGLHPCVTIELYCRQCGAIRVTQESEQLRCPICSIDRPGCVLGYGFTRRDLPIYRVLHMPIPEHVMMSRAARRRETFTEIDVT